MSSTPQNKDDGPNSWPTFQISSLDVAPKGTVETAPANPLELDIHQPGLLALLCQLVQEHDVARRRLAVDLLTQLGPRIPGSVPALQDLLTKGDPGTRSRVAEVLSQFGEQASPAIPALVAALRHSSDQVRRWSSYALGQIGPLAQGAIPPLLELRALTGDVRSRAIVTAALKHIDPVAGASNKFSQPEQAVGEIHRLYGHRSWVQCVSFSADGQLAISGSGQPSGGTAGDSDFTVRLWDIESGLELRCLQGHTDRVTCVGYLPDGNSCFSGSHDETIRLWDCHSGQELRTLQGHEDRVRSVSVSPDGVWILSGGCDKSARLWDLGSGRLVRSYPPFSHWVIAAAFCPDSLHALTCTLDDKARLWQALYARQVRESQKGGWLGKFFGSGKTSPSGPGQTVTCATFDTVRKRVVVACPDGTVRLRDVMTGQELCRVETGAHGVLSVAISADCKRLLTGGTDNTLRLWDAATGQPIHCFFGHSDVVTSVAISPDGKLALSGSGDRSVRVWRLPQPGWTPVAEKV